MLGQIAHILKMEANAFIVLEAILTNLAYSQSHQIKKIQGNPMDLAWIQEMSKEDDYEIYINYK